MIHNLNNFVNESSGSSLNFSAHGWWGKEKNCNPAEKIAVGSEGEAEGGCGGNSASPEPKRSPVALLVQSRTKQKNFPFLLEEKIGRAQIQIISKGNFSARHASGASGGGAERQFRSKKFRAKFRISHQSQLSPFWERIASRLRRSAFWLCARRKARKSHGGQKEKEMDLIFSHLK
ncbi:MAG: hypothetical protein Q8L01_01160 [Candidatus Woesebacteria bacterium]|nr:hypothetical protein [Candidatus Woesebacteria bacterium]